MTTYWFERTDIRVLELERKGAMSATEVTTQDKAGEAEPHTSDCTSDDGAQSSASWTRSRGQKGQEIPAGRNESRCIFTPVKKARKYEQPLDAVQRLQGARGERPPSSIASGVDMLFINDGEELPHKTRAQHAKQASTTDPAPSETRISSFSQHFNGNGSQDRLEDVQQLQLQQSGLDRDFDKGAFDSKGRDDGQHLFDGVYDQQTFSDDTSETDQREFQRWKVKSNPYADFNPDLPFDCPDSASFSRENVHGTPPSSPVDASPLSFRMSRAEVLQSQLSTTVHDATCDHVEHLKSYTPILHPSPSPPTSTSSEGSILLGRPPLGWQKKLMLSLREDTMDQPENRFGSPASFPGETSPSSPTNVADGNWKDRRYLCNILDVWFVSWFTGIALLFHAAYNPDRPKRFALESSPSPSSSTGSDGENSLLNAAVPANAKEHIMAAATSQHFPPDSRMWFLRPTDMTKLGETNGADAAFSGKSMAFQQSWVMSSRTKTILDAVSSFKDPSVEHATEEPKTKYQEMESVAVYMYTLVQCYKIDESLRADRHSLPVAEHAQPVRKASSPPAATALTSQTACRREIIFSPKHAD